LAKANVVSFPLFFKCQSLNRQKVFEEALQVLARGREQPVTRFTQAKSLDVEMTERGFILSSE